MLFKTKKAFAILPTVAFGGSINEAFPNPFQIGNPENEPGKLETHFDDLLVESLQRKSCRRVQMQKKAERRRRGKKEDGASKDHQPNKGDNQINA